MLEGKYVQPTTIVIYSIHFWLLRATLKTAFGLRILVAIRLIGVFFGASQIAYQFP